MDLLPCTHDSVFHIWSGSHVAMEAQAHHPSSWDEVPEGSRVLKTFTRPPRFVIQARRSSCSRQAL
eukprot:745461-Rhodomonas_salina.1